jgi:curved DNA-binding protein
VLGSDVTVDTLGGPVQLTVKPGTRAGQQLRLQKRGLGSGDRQGDQFAVVQIAVPSQVSDEERELYSRLAEKSNFHPRGRGNPR